MIKISMNKTGEEKKDKVIYIGNYSLIHEDNDINYNISHFLRNHGSNKHRKRIENLNTFTHLLDAKLHIDTSDPKYKHIYQGIDIIVKRVVSYISKIDHTFSNAKLIKTGSSMSGVKVGLPHEANYILELPEKLSSGKSVDTGYLFALVLQVIKEHTESLTAELAHWIIHGVKLHSNIAGVCIFMQCRAD